MARLKRPAENGYALVERSDSPRSSPFGTPRSLSPNPRSPMLSNPRHRAIVATALVVLLTMSALIVGMSNRNQDDPR